MEDLAFVIWLFWTHLFIRLEPFVIMCNWVTKQAFVTNIVHSYRIWLRRILNPIPIRIIPPTSSALFPNNFPAFLADRKPTAVTVKAIAPIIELASAIFTFRKAKDSPTAKASMLVATDRIRSREPLVMSVFLWLSLGRNDSQIILPPTIANRMKATQWS